MNSARTVRNVTLVALATLPLVVGLIATARPEVDSTVVERILAALSAGGNVTLILLAVGLLASWLQQRAVKLLAVLGSAAAASVALDTLLRGQSLASLDPPDVAPVLACLLVACGVLLDTFWKSALARTFVVALLEGAACISTVVMIGAIASARDTSTLAIPSVQLLGCVALSLGWLDYVLRDGCTYGGQPVRSPVLPIVFTAACGAGATYWLMVTAQGTSGHEPLAWLTLLPAATFALVVVLLLAVLADERLRDLGTRETRLSRMVRRQRRMFHTRTADLHDAEGRYADLFNAVPAPLVLTTRDGKVLAANPAMVKFLRVSSEAELKGRNFSSFYAQPEDRQRLVEQWEHSADSDHSGEVELRLADGEQKNVLYSLQTIRDRDGAVASIRGTITDISELRRAEARRRQIEMNLRLSQKLESVGRLAAGVAHEINTPMQYIGDNVFFLKQCFDTVQELLAQQKRVLEDAARLSGTDVANRMWAAYQALDLESGLDAAPAAFERTQQGVKSVSHIVAAMRRLAHPDQGAKSSTDIADVVDTALTVTRNVYKTVANIETEIQPVPNILAFKNELCQVFINLIVNAAHAIETAKQSRTFQGVIRIGVCEVGDQIEIVVEDNGCGIPQSVIDKIFDPFFTTKPVGQGTGQGLAIARAAIVDKHGGGLAVRSEMGQGSVFTIRIPTKEPSVTADPGAEE